MHSIEENLSNTITNLLGLSYNVETYSEDIKLYNIPQVLLQ